MNERKSEELGMAISYFCLPNYRPLKRSYVNYTVMLGKICNVGLHGNFSWHGGLSCMHNEDIFIISPFV